MEPEVAGGSHDQPQSNESTAPTNKPTTNQSAQVNVSSTQETSNDESILPSAISQDEKELLRDKMRDMFAKFITDIDNHVLDVGKSQCELDSQLDQLIATLDSIKIDEKLTTDISENAKRISTLKSRLTVIHTILSDASARCGRTLAACGAAMQNATATSPSNPSTSISSPLATNDRSKASNQ